MKEKITIENYFLETKGKFQFVKEYEKTNILSMRKGNDENLLTYFRMKLNIKHLELNYISYNEYYNNISVYFYDRKKDTLYRLSDHGSKTNFKEPNYLFNECGSIRSCGGELKFRNRDMKIGNLVCPVTKKLNSGEEFLYAAYETIQLGKIKVSKLKKNKN